MVGVETEVTGPSGFTAASPLVVVEGLTFRYRRATEPAIRDVSLTVEPTSPVKNPTMGPKAYTIVRELTSQSGPARLWNRPAQLASRPRL